MLVFCRRLPQGQWWWRALVLGTLNIGAFFYLLFLAAYSMPGGIAALLISSQPLWVLLFGAVLLRQAFTAQHILACVVGALGVAGLVIQSDASLNVTGVSASILGAICMALGVVLAKHWGKPEGVSLLDLTGWQLTVGGIVLMPLAMWWEPFPQSMTMENYLGLGFLCLVGALLTYIIWFRSIQRLPAFLVSIITLLSPLSAAALGYLVLDEQLNLEQGIGAALIITSMFMAQRAAQSTQKKTQSPQTA
ncbi:EamA family transporter [Enterovibrio coralii]|uniref:EamA family transporter n=1 Tax=Enterovibrio coralii TaxID=294935 RepID=UPI000AA5E359|nr:EamA family transporter [Enterovibrio coralii]